MALGLFLLISSFSTLSSIASNLSLHNNSVSPQTGNDGFTSWSKLLWCLAYQRPNPGQTPNYVPRPNLVVAKDGSGNYRTIRQAIDAAPKLPSNGWFVIHVKSGVYKEKIVITKPNIMMVGDGMGRTIITGDKSFVGNHLGTQDTATVGVDASGFIARGITFRNTAGPYKGQAVAFQSNGDRTVLYQCSFEGYQDTLYTQHNRQFYKDCHIYGTVDMICGAATAVFQNCTIFLRKPNPKQVNTITAHNRQDNKNNTAIVIQYSRVVAAEKLGSVKTYLGRPWGSHARTVFMQTHIDSLVDPAGWLPWSPQTPNTLQSYYAEYKNTGPGSSTNGRVKWPGYKGVLNPQIALQFTVAELLDGYKWLPATHVPFLPY